MNKTDNHIGNLKNLLVVDDDERIRTLLKEYLVNEGFIISTAESAIIAREKMKILNFDLIILDVMMPEVDGFKFTNQIRETSQTPIILLTAKSEIDSKIEGLEIGADDYITKPFSPNELIARINSLLRRSSTQNKQIIEFQDLSINLNEHKVYRGNKKIHLGPTEYKLLKHLMENPGRVYSREQLLNSVWGHGIFVEVRTVDTHIRRLRKALNKTGAKNYIRTIRAAGYSIDYE